MTDLERQQEAAKGFLCRCGSTLVFESCHEGTRIVCYDLSRRTQRSQKIKEHDEPTAWYASREDAVQIREVIRAMTRD